MHFEELHLNVPLLRAVTAAGYETPTPIQAQAIPHVLAGKDLIGCAQTGTGKTAAFSLPILQQMMDSGVPLKKGKRPIRALILSPTRELATQIGDNIAMYGSYTGLRRIVIFGGVKQTRQEQALQRGADVLVATPGRLLDLMGQGIIRLDHVEYFVLDEADRMLDMGFIHDVRKIVDALPSKRQSLLFSATMPPDIQKFAAGMLKDPVRVDVAPQATTVESIDQSVFFVDKNNKRALLQHIMADHAMQRVLVFTRTKHGANKLAQYLDKANIRAAAIHGNKSQAARERALDQFKQGKVRALVATDIASRGIDVDAVTHVINFDLPNEPESYVHRIGRTARAGASGIAYSFCDAEERSYLRDIEKLIRLRVNIIDEHPYPALEAEVIPTKKSRSNSRSRNNRGGDFQHDGGSRNGPSRRSSAKRRSNGNGQSSGENRSRRSDSQRRSASGGNRSGSTREG